MRASGRESTMRSISSYIRGLPLEFFPNCVGFVSSLVLGIYLDQEARLLCHWCGDVLADRQMFVQICLFGFWATQFLSYLSSTLSSALLCFCNQGYPFSTISTEDRGYTVEQCIVQSTHRKLFSYIVSNQQSFAVW